MKPVGRFATGMLFCAVLTVVILSDSLANSVSSPDERSIRIRQGQFPAFGSAGKLPDDKAPKTTVGEFEIDAYPVTNSEYLSFVKANSEWRRSKVKKIFADGHYLEDWESDVSIGKLNLKSPVVRVSWFAAIAFCESFGKSLPTTDQWEFVLYDGGKNQQQLNEKILAWYSKPNQAQLGQVGSTDKNTHGIYDLGALVWEWTEDFNSFLSISDSRGGSGKDSGLFCGGGSQMGNPADYPAFMRFSFRASLQAKYTTANLGFRCARGIK